jgi:hypothetical protein
MAQEENLKQIMHNRDCTQILSENAFDRMQIEVKCFHKAKSSKSLTAEP